jgi:integrase
MTTRRPTKTPGVYAYDTAKGERHTVRWRGTDGRPHEKRGLATYADAKRFKKAVDGEVAQGRNLKVQRRSMTVREYYRDEWWPVHGPTLTKKTRDNYEYLFRVHILPFFGNYVLEDLRKSDIKRFLGHMKNKPDQRRRRGKKRADSRLSNSTINHAKTKLGIMLNAAVGDEVIDANVCALVRTTRAQASPKNALSVKQVEQLVEAMQPKSWRPAVIVAAYCGLRPGEISALQRRDIDLEAGTIRITASQVEDDSGRLVRNEETKTAVARTIPMTDVAAEALESMLDRRGHVKSDSAAFRSPLGYDFRQSNFRHAVKLAARNAKLPDWVTPYTLRHTCATILARAGVPVHVAAAYMGHDPAVFLRTYAHLFANDLSAAAQAIGDHRGDELAPVIPIRKDEAG